VADQKLQNLQTEPRRAGTVFRWRSSPRVGAWQRNLPQPFIVVGIGSRVGAPYNPCTTIWSGPRHLQRPGPVSCPYSPKYLEEVFSEVRMQDPE
jgi:hypothetical protein